MNFKLKPQWNLQLQEDRVLLVSETQVFAEDLGYAAILQRLVSEIVNDESLTDAEFVQVEHLNSRGFLTTDDHPDAAAWELHGSAFTSVQEQINHLTFSIVDRCRNQGDWSVAHQLAIQLCRFGLRQEQDDTKAPSVTLVVCDSYSQVPAEPNRTDNVLPVVVNRMKLSVGPFLFPWTVIDPAAIVAANPNYVDQVKYQLPEPFKDLQVIWIATAIAQALLLNKNKFVGNFVEFNMLNLRETVWPIRLPALAQES